MQREQARHRQLTAISRLRAMHVEQAQAQQSKATQHLLDQRARLHAERDAYRLNLGALSALTGSEHQLYPELHEQMLINQQAAGARLEAASEAFSAAETAKANTQKQLIEAQLAESLISTAISKVERNIRSNQQLNERLDTSDAQLARGHTYGF